MFNTVLDISSGAYRGDAVTTMREPTTGITIDLVDEYNNFDTVTVQMYKFQLNAHKWVEGLTAMVNSAEFYGSKGES
jgi:hypothetical protein